MSQPTKKKLITFKSDLQDEGIVALVEEREKIDEGTYGNIFIVMVQVRNHVRRFVLKKFKIRDSIDDPQRDSIDALANYQALKSAGLKVFPTYRISENKDSILMTCGNSDDWTCIGSNANTCRLSYFEEDDIDEITNLDELIGELSTQAEKAAKAGLQVFSPIYFFLVHKKDKGRLDFVLGDLDAIEHNTFLNFWKLWEWNVNAALFALKQFMEINLKAAGKEDHLERIKKAKQETLEKIRH